MTTTERPRPRSAPNPGPGSASRGLILVVVGVVLGAILLLRGGGVGFDDDSTGVDIESGSEVTTTTVPPETTLPVAQPPAAVKVVVANGSGVSGLAGKGTQFLARAGYTASSATDATQPTTSTVVYFAPGFEANAAAIAELVGLPSDRTQPLAGQVGRVQPPDTGVVVLLARDAEPAIAGSDTTVAGPAGTSGAGGTGSPATTVAGAATTVARPTTTSP
jgi:hypothetical protein